MSFFDRFRGKSEPSDPQSDHPYPFLRTFFGAYLNQDYDIFGDTADEVTASFRDENTPVVVDRLISDIRRFLADHEAESDNEFKESYLRSFHPDMSFEDEKHQTARAFLADRLPILEGERGILKRDL